MQPQADTSDAQPEPLGRLFLRFLKFGLLAWGGPVAQIGMIRQELVEQAGWVSRERFNRILAVYQVLPGPEAHELCVYFGMVARGQLGALLAGLGFMLPGFILMFCLSWFYVTYGLSSPLFAAVFAGFQAAVIALIVRATHHIGRYALTDRTLWIIAVVVGVLQLLAVNFVVSLGLAGLSYAVVVNRKTSNLSRFGLLLPALGARMLSVPKWILLSLAATAPTIPQLLGSGLRAGLLTFGGAYTVIPFLHNDAVVQGAWMSNAEFLDGLALSSVLPAPLVIFATFVGYMGGGPAGSLAVTAGIFLPAFGFTMLGHRFLERLIDNRSAHAFLDGVTAGVVGLITATALVLARDALASPATIGIFLAALLVLYRWQAKTAVAVVVLGAGLVGLFLFR